MLGNSTPPIIIVGMHRSGTSLITHLLGEMGVHVGNRKSTQHEAYTFRHVNVHLLRAAGGHWARPEPFLSRLSEPGYIEKARQEALTVLDQYAADFGPAQEGQRWGWKDPRTTVTLPVWRGIYPDAKVIHVERSGLAVALSLHRREWKILRRRIVGLRFTGQRGWMFPPTLIRGYQLWEVYTRAALADQPHWQNWLTIKYETLLARPYETLRELTDFAGLTIKAEELKQLAETHIHKPSAASPAELGRFRLMARLGFIKIDLMKQLGYDITGA